MLSKENLDELNRSNREHYHPHIEMSGVDIVEDGLVDLDSYNLAKYKILWILKEANDADGDGGWSITGDLLTKIRDGNKIKAGLEKTFTKIVYATYGMLKDYVYDGMDYIRDDPNMIDVIQSIAFINIKKQPGGAVANSRDLKQHYDRDKQIILNQINVFNPDIIIFGGTAGYLITDLGLNKGNETYVKDCNFWLKDGILYIEAEHPNGRSSKTENYVDGMVEAVRSTKKNIFLK